MATELDYIKNYVFTNDIEQDGKIILARLKYDCDLFDFDENVDRSYINYKFTYEHLKNKTELNGVELFYLARYHYNNTNDEKVAQKYYEMAVEKGNAMAMVYLGVFHEDHYEDHITAKKLYEMAYDKGYVAALNNLSFIYMFYEKIMKRQKNV